MGNGVSGRTPRAGLLPGYVAFAHWRPALPALDPRLELLVAQLSAELSGCAWCIEQGRHRWRQAALPAALLGQLRSYRGSPLVAEREAAALALTEAIARYTDREPRAADAALTVARRYFNEEEVARLARLAAGDHFFDPATGGVGQDVAGQLAPTDNHSMPWSASTIGIAVRGRQ